MRNNFFSFNPFLFKINRASISNSIVIDQYKVGYSYIYITSDGRYIIEDPIITQSEIQALNNILEYLLYKLHTIEITDENKFEEAIKKMGIKNDKLIYFLKREIFGFGVLDPAVKDSKVEDIQIPAPNVPARIIHSDYDKLISNIVLDENELNNYVEKLVYKSGKNISAFRPLLSIRSSDTTRLTVTYKKEVGHKGSSITIRKFPENPWSITRLIVKNTLDPMMAAWLMQLIENKKAILIIGGMGCGKTSLINGLCNCINERATIITVEDTPELRLAHPYWIPLITRESLTLDEKGSIDMFTLVKHALRMSGDYLIVGEVRGEEGRIWAQAIMTGHGGITSFHAETHNVAIERLINEPINVDIGSLASLHSIVNIKKYVLIKEDERGIPRKVFVRRIAGIYDLEVQLEKKKVKFYKMFSYDSLKDSFNVPKLENIVRLPTAKLIMEEKGWDEKMFIDDLIMKYKFFLKLKEKSLIEEKFLDYRFVTQLIWKFYENPKQFKLEEIKEEEKEGKEIEVEEGISVGETENV